MTEQIESVVSTLKEGHTVQDATAEAFGKLLNKAITEVTETENKITIVDDNGNEKIYTQVAVRNDIFRRIFGFKARILTRIRDDIKLENQQDTVIMEAVLDMLLDGKYVRVANAFAGKTQYQAALSQKGQSVIQLAETAAVGRVLASIGLSGGEFATLEDMVDLNNGEKITKNNLKITKVQKEKIKSSLSDKSLKMSDFPLIESVDDLSYQEAMDLIEDINKSPVKSTTRSRPVKKDAKKDLKTSAKKTTAKKANAKKPAPTDKSDEKEDGSLL